MSQAISVVAFGLVAVWIVAHLLYLGPVRTAIGLVIAWLAGLLAASVLLAAVTILGWGLILGRTTRPWLRFAGHARTLAAVLGCGLVIVGLLHYRDTEPRGEIGWVVAGLVVLGGAGLIHVWLLATARRNAS